MWLSVRSIIICIGLQVPVYYSRQIGCYSIDNVSVNKTEIFSNNSGKVCLEYCSKTTSTRYAGTSHSRCYCLGEIKGRRADVWDCDVVCPGVISEEMCGGVNKITAYDGQKLTSKAVEPTSRKPSLQHNSTTSTQSTSSNFKTQSKEERTSKSSAKPFSVQSTNTPTSTADTSRTSNMSAMLPEQHIVSSSEIPHFISMCVMVCFAVILCVLIINNVSICMYRKCRKSTKGNNTQTENYGYIRPVDVTNMVDRSTVYKTPSSENIALKFEENSSNVYEYVESSTTDMVDKSTVYYTPSFESSIARNFVENNSEYHYVESSIVEVHSNDSV